MKRTAFVLFIAFVVACLAQAPRPPVDKLSQLTDVHLTSPTNNQVLTFDSVTGKWINKTGGGGGGSPGGNDQDVQFNDSGSFGGDDNFTWNNNDKALTVGNSNGGQSFQTIFGDNIGNGLSIVQQSNGHAAVNITSTNLADASQAIGLYVSTASNNVHTTGAYGLYVSTAQIFGGSGSLDTAYALWVNDQDLLTPDRKSVV